MAYCSNIVQIHIRSISWLPFRAEFREKKDVNLHCTQMVLLSTSCLHAGPFSRVALDRGIGLCVSFNRIFHPRNLLFVALCYLLSFYLNVFALGFAGIIALEVGNSTNFLCC